jgi:DNA-binding response OmpR family regulator
MSRHRLLLVDDDVDVCESHSIYLNSVGFEVDTAADAPSALAAVRRRPPDVVLLDYVLPGMNGIDLLNLLRDIPNMRRVPVLFLSGRDSGLQAVHGAQWLRKPVPLAVLTTRIEQVLADADIVRGTN